MTTAARWAVGLALVVATTAAGQAVPRQVELSPPARAALQSTALTDAERAALRLRHGTWADADLTTADQRAQAALTLWKLEDVDPAAAPALRAAALNRAGKPAEALAALGQPSTPAALLQAAYALEQMGQYDKAAAAAKAVQQAAQPPAQQPAAAPTTDDRLDAVEATTLLGRVGRVPTAAWQGMLDQLAALREADRLDPRPRLLEGRLLVDRDRFEDGVKALQEALALNPRLSEAWYLLGCVALRTYDFDGARRAARELRELNPDHPLALLLEGETALQSRVPEEAVTALDALLARYPGQRQALALRAAADAARFDTAATASRLAALDALEPGSPHGYYQVGRFLSLARQYQAAADALNQAAARAPEWSVPVAELGLMEMQSGRDEQALAALRRAVELDPFDERARYSRTLMEMLATWPRIEGERFTVRYKPGADEVVARMMPAALDAMSTEVTGWLDHVPAQKTVIELHPDHRSFAVRITGMPWIHTIAASTGPLIALEAPREGAPEKHLGRFDWLEVLRHEYVHTVTLDQTNNRIPHWFTEALAVRMETKPRTFETAQMLAAAYAKDTLFNLEDINWAFVRPRKPTDRSQAYAQGRWMVEFIEATWGRAAILQLLDAYRDGVNERDAFQKVLGVTRETFMERFKEFARSQLQAWGLQPQPPLAQLMDSLRAEQDQPSGPITVDDATLATWLAAHPTHPDLLEMQLRRALKDGQDPTPEQQQQLAAYASARPVDPWPHRLLATAALRSADPLAAIPHLERLDALEDSEPSYALELARLERKRGNRQAALTHAMKAVRIDPYDPRTREFVAALAVEAGALAEARAQIEALVALEPSVERHRERLERVNALLRGATPAAP